MGFYNVNSEARDGLEYNLNEPHLLNMNATTESFS